MPRRMIGHASRVLAGLAGVVVVLVMVVTAMDVGRRNLGISSIRGLIEYTEVALVVIALMGLSQTQREDGHIGVEYVVDRLGGRIGQALEAFGLAAMCLILAYLTYATGLTALDSVARQEVRIGHVPVPVWPARLVIPVAGLLTLIETAIQLRDKLVSLFAATTPVGR